MKSLVANRILLAIVFITGVAVVEAFSQPKLKKDEAIAEERQAARQIWEQAIAAKGGRERLHAVRNFVTSRQFVMKSEGKEFDVSEEQFYVFPDRFFERDHTHDRTGPYSRLNIRTCDLRVPVCWQQSNLREPYSIPNPLKRYSIGFPWIQLFYLMETKRVQPEPVKMWTKRVGFTKYDVVQTVVDGGRVDFFLDRRTHLVRRITTYSGLSESERTEKGVYSFEDYVDVNGIMMPQKVMYGSLGWEHRTYEINVEYDDRIFGRPPMVDLGTKAWRRREP